MTDRIYAWREPDADLGFWSDNPESCGSPYISADLVAELVEALRELARDPRDTSTCVGDGWQFYEDSIAFARAALAKMEGRG